MLCTLHASENGQKFMHLATSGAVALHRAGGFRPTAWQTRLPGRQSSDQRNTTKQKWRRRT